MPNRPSPVTGAQRGSSALVGNLLLIAVALFLAISVGTIALGFTNQVPRANPQTAVQWENSNAGLLLVPRSMTDDVRLVINGETIRTVSTADLNKEILVPAAPGDRVALVGDTGPDDILVQKHVRDREAGDFIAYYTFEAGSGSTLVDRSPNENDASLKNGPTWVNDAEGTALQFDGSDDYVTVDRLNTENATEVSEFTVAVKFRIEGATGSIQQLVEHRNDTTGFEWFLETEGGNMPYRVKYNVWPDGTNPPGVVSSQYTSGQTHVAVATFNEETMHLYVDGTLVGSEPRSGTIEMGSLFIGADAVDADTQHFKGRMYQLRIYYTAMDDAEIRMLTDVMDAEAE